MQPNRQELPRSADVVVIGGGVIGAACCQALAEAGLVTTLIEAGQLGSGASGACEGNVLVSDKSPGPEFDLARRSLELFDGLEQRLHADIQLERKGSLLVANSEQAAAGLEQQIGWMDEAGLEIELLDAATAREAEPVLHPEIAGALSVADDIQVCPLKLVTGLASSAVRHGATVLQGLAVEAIEAESGKVTGVRTGSGRIACDSIVLSAGVPSRFLLDPLGFHLPIEGRRGQILVGAPMPGLIKRKVYDFGYRATITDRESGVQVATVLETTLRGNVLIGASRELQNSSTVPDAAVNALLAERALELAPGLAGVRILRSYAGVRPTLPDGLPVIGPVDGVEGLWLASGHEGAGIGLAPGTAEIICSLATGDGTPAAAEAFSPSRLLPDAVGGSPEAGSE